MCMVASPPIELLLIGNVSSTESRCGCLFLIQQPWDVRLGVKKNEFDFYVCMASVSF